MPTSATPAAPSVLALETQQFSCGVAWLTCLAGPTAAAAQRAAAPVARRVTPPGQLHPV